MRILVANPNATEAITDVCLALARGAASPGTELTGWTNRQGPPIIDSFYGDYMAGRPLARAVVEIRPLPDAVVLAGFGNYGTAAVKEILDVPVIAMAEAAMAFAMPFCHRFAIVTTSPRMIPYTQDLVTFLGFDAHCAGVRAVSMPPPDPSQPGQERVLDQLAEEVGRVTETGAADLVILGGALLSPYAGALRARTPVPVIEPVACAVQMAEAVVRLDLRQSKLRKFAPPPRRLAEYG
ncbi:MAG: Asp/Glu/hydantoin racemase [Candidatus Rokuibacteriota bacterium]|nr:MAG: Asp/Glu/hydantoin racemase [Candidatus Rokubacteria bacterium]